MFFNFQWYMNVVIKSRIFSSLPLSVLDKMISANDVYFITHVNRSTLNGLTLWLQPPKFT
jgi:hypothetical protein